MEEETQQISAPSLVSPADGAAIDETDVTLRWQPVPEATGYGLQVARDRDFETLFFEDSLGDQTSYVLGSLPDQAGTALYWRVRAEREAAGGNYSEAGRFVTADWTAAPAPAAVGGKSAPGNVATRRREWIFLVSAIFFSAALIVAPLVLFSGRYLDVAPEEGGETDRQALLRQTRLDGLAKIRSYVPGDEGSYRIPVDEAMGLVLKERYAASSASSNAVPAAIPEPNDAEESGRATENPDAENTD